MHGGHGGRLFFSGQVLKYANKLHDELPQEGYTFEEEEAGFESLAKAFGFYSTLDNIARYVGQTDKEVLKWSTNEFYTKLKLLAWRAHAQKKYGEIMANKK